MSPETSDLDVHPASESERLEIYRNVHDFWPNHENVDEHVARRLKSPTHQRAEWFAGLLDGRVVTSLGCQPLRFRLHGRSVPGFAICAVHTVAAFRGRGIAPRLLGSVERFQAEQGRPLALLYSDVGHDYYARLGYRAGRSHVGCVELTDVRVAAADSEAREVQPEDYRRLVTPLAARRPLSIERPPDYWDFLGRREPGRSCFVVTNGDVVGGFVLSDPVEETVRLLEIDTRGDGDLETVAHSAVHVARSLGARRLEGWCPADLGASSGLEVTPREDELTMLKSLDDSVSLDEAALAATDWFHESDHV